MCLPPNARTDRLRSGIHCERSPGATGLAEAGISRRPGDTSGARLPLSFRALLFVALEFAKRDLFRNDLNNLVLDPPPKSNHGCLPQFDSLSSRLRTGWRNDYGLLYPIA